MNNTIKNNRMTYILFERFITKKYAEKKQIITRTVIGYTFVANNKGIP